MSETGSFVVGDPSLGKLREMISSGDPNWIGQVGEIIAKEILAKLYPHPNYVVLDSKEVVEFLVLLRKLARKGAEQIVLDYYPDFVIIPRSAGERMVVVEVKTTIHRKTRIRGHAKKEWKEQLEKLKQLKKGFWGDSPSVRCVLLSIRMERFPLVRYSMREI